ncbi:MAG: hypothetical protein NTX30_19245 [Deltaproteobacteria bacterium]|jgi:hypothetical protein|nr:hypothetical protein [Deltaproteobacteria bacterium]
MFWTPAFAGVTLQETFYEIINAWKVQTMSLGLEEAVALSLFFM